MTILTSVYKVVFLIWILAASTSPSHAQKYTWTKTYDRSTFDVIKAIYEDRKIPQQFSKIFPHTLAPSEEMTITVHGPLLSRVYTVSTLYGDHYRGPTKVRAQFFDKGKEVSDSSFFGLSKTLAEEALADIEEALKKVPPGVYKRLEEL